MAGYEFIPDLKCGSPFILPSAGSRDTHINTVPNNQVDVYKLESFTPSYYNEEKAK